MTSRRTPGRGRYSEVEREQRWLVRDLPGGLTRPGRIHDRYIDGTRLRLRRADLGGDVVWKLGQKVRDDERSPEVVRLTNMYLSEGEWRALRRLPGAELHKTRFAGPPPYADLSVDVFEGRHAGLVLAEVELAEDAPFLEPPTFAVRDVTHDDRYSGGALAHADDDEIAELSRASRGPSR